jgi:hypothetical protein
MNTFVFVTLLMIQPSWAWNPHLPIPTTRKHVLQLIGATWLLGTTVAEAAPPKIPPKYLTERGSYTQPLSPCNGQPIKKNCWSTEDTGGRKLQNWQPPKELVSKGTSNILTEIEETIRAYPQEGQSDVDKGGWKLAERATSSADGSVAYLRYEFTSGRFKYVDDLEIRIDINGKVCTRSASREGGFDYDVNKNRLNYIASLLSNKGWTVKKLL